MVDKYWARGHLLCAQLFHDLHGVPGLVTDQVFCLSGLSLTHLVG